MKFLPRTPLDLIADLVLMAIGLAIIVWLVRSCA